MSRYRPTELGSLTQSISLVAPAYMRRLDEIEAKLVEGTEDACCPFFSPDGRWLGFAGGSLKKVAVSGGAPLAICDMSAVNGATWGPDGTIVFGHRRAV